MKSVSAFPSSFKIHKVCVGLRLTVLTHFYVENNTQIEQRVSSHVHIYRSMLTSTSILSSMLAWTRAKSDARASVRSPFFSVSASYPRFAGVVIFCFTLFSYAGVCAHASRFVLCSSFVLVLILGIRFHPSLSIVLPSSSLLQFFPFSYSLFFSLRAYT